MCLFVCLFACHDVVTKSVWFWSYLGSQNAGSPQIRTVMCYSFQGEFLLAGRVVTITRNLFKTHRKFQSERVSKKHIGDFSGGSMELIKLPRLTCLYLAGEIWRYLVKLPTSGIIIHNMLKTKIPGFVDENPGDSWWPVHLNHPIWHLYTPEV